MCLARLLGNKRAVGAYCMFCAKPFRSLTLADVASSLLDITSHSLTQSPTSSNRTISYSACAFNSLNSRAHEKDKLRADPARSNTQTPCPAYSGIQGFKGRASAIKLHGRSRLLISILGSDAKLDVSAGNNAMGEGAQVELYQAPWMKLEL